MHHFRFLYLRYGDTSVRQRKYVIDVSKFQTGISERKGALSKTIIFVVTCLLIGIDNQGSIYRHNFSLNWMVAGYLVWCLEDIRD